MIKVNRRMLEWYNYSVRYDVEMTDIYSINCGPESKKEWLLLCPSRLRIPYAVVLGGDFVRAIL